MKDYYERLNINKDASQNDVKRGYFSLIRKFPPEKYPKEFIEIREAYEILINEETRKEYDSVSLMPDIVKAYYKAAEESIQQGRIENAIELLELVIKAYPKLNIVKSLLGDVYLLNDNFGKAIKIFQDLVKKDKGNPRYCGKLADAYLERGWHRKSAEQYILALKLDKDNVGFWQGLINSYSIAEENEKTKAVLLDAIEYGNSSKWDNTQFFYQLINHDLENDHVDSLKFHLEDFKVYIKNNIEYKEEALEQLNRYIELFERNFDYQLAAVFIKIANELSPQDKELKKKKEIFVKRGAIDSNLDRMELDPTIHKVLLNLLVNKFFGFDMEDSPDKIYTQFVLEIRIFHNIDLLKEQIIRIKDEYPILYELKAEFFDDVIKPEKSNRMAFQFKKRLDNINRKLVDGYKHVDFYDIEKEDGVYVDRYDNECDDKYNNNYDDSYYDDDEDDYDSEDDFLKDWESALDFLENSEPFMREEPKVGRNEPCPCGSGKKYKKCCGKD